MRTSRVLNCAIATSDNCRGCGVDDDDTASDWPSGVQIGVSVLVGHKVVVEESGTAGGIAGVLEIIGIGVLGMGQLRVVDMAVPFRGCADGCSYSGLRGSYGRDAVDFLGNPFLCAGETRAIIVVVVPVVRSEETGLCVR